MFISVFKINILIKNYSKNKIFIKIIIIIKKTRSFIIYVTHNTFLNNNNKKKISQNALKNILRVAEMLIM
jgi:hypothetical protein